MLRKNRPSSFHAHSEVDWWATYTQQWSAEEPSLQANSFPFWILLKLLKLYESLCSFKAQHLFMPASHLATILYGKGNVEKVQKRVEKEVVWLISVVMKLKVQRNNIPKIPSWKKDATQRITEGPEYDWLKGKTKGRLQSYIQTFEVYLQMGYGDLLCVYLKVRNGINGWKLSSRRFCFNLKTRTFESQKLPNYGLLRRSCTPYVYLWETL